MPILLVFLLAAFSTPLGAAKYPDVPILTPYVSESAAAFSFRGLEDDHGGFYLIWPHEERGVVSLMGQHLDGQGHALWDKPGVPLAVELSTGAAWDAAADGQGGLLLSWEKGLDVFAQRFESEHKPVWPPLDQAVSASTATRKSPVITPDGAGGAYVVWQERIMQGRWVLMAQHVNTLGARLWPQGGMRVSRRPSEQRNPRVVFDGAAGIVAAWQDFNAGASQLQVQRLDYQGGRRWGDAGQLVTAPAGDPARAPYVAAVGKGSAMLAWQASSSAADRIFLQWVDPAGKFGWGPQGKELTLGSWNQWNPVLHGDGEGGAWVGWEDFRNNQTWQVYLQHYMANGQAVWNSQGVTLTSTNSDQGRLTITDDTKGNILAAWVDNRLGSVGLYLQKLSAAGLGLLGPEGLKVAEPLTNPQTPQVVSLAADQAAVVWADAPAKGRWMLFWKLVPTLPMGQK